MQMDWPWIINQITLLFGGALFWLGLIALLTLLFGTLLLQVGKLCLLLVPPTTSRRSSMRQHKRSQRTVRSASHATHAAHTPPSSTHSPGSLTPSGLPAGEYIANPPIKSTVTVRAEPVAAKAISDVATLLSDASEDPTQQYIDLHLRIAIEPETGWQCHLVGASGKQVHDYRV